MRGKERFEFSFRIEAADGTRSTLTVEASTWREALALAKDEQDGISYFPLGSRQLDPIVPLVVFA